MPDFIAGRELCSGFFHEIAAPILKRHFPDLVFSAGLLGYGSDVLGFDDATSTDHMWGPRFYLFLDREDIALSSEIKGCFAREFPYTYKGHSVHFSLPDPNDGGVRVAESIDAGEVSPLVFIYTPDDFLIEYLGTSDLDAIEPLRWLTFAEHRLLALASGELYVDGLGMAARLASVSEYPPDVARYLIASQWALIGEEQAFVTRTGRRGDVIGTQIICARIVERLMRLCFLYCRRYAPYSKWFGTAFARLPIDAAIGKEMALALVTGNVDERERHLVAAQLLVVDLHNRCNLVAPVVAEAQNYHTRPIQVIYADRIAAAVAAQLAETPLADAHLIGTLSQIGNFVGISDDPAHHLQIEGLYAANAHLK